MLKQILKLYKGQAKWIFIFSFLTVFNGGLSIIIPLGTKYMVDSFLGHPIPISIKWIFISLIIIILTRAIFWYFFRLISDIIGSGIELKLRLRFYKHIQKLPNTFFKNKESGDITSTIINDISSIKTIAQLLPDEVLWIFAIFFGVMIVSYLISPQMFVVMLCVFIVNAFFIWLTSKDMKKVYEAIKKERGKVNQEALNSFHGITESKAFNNEAFDYKRFKKASVKYRNSWWKAVKKIGIHDMVGSLSMYASTFVILIIGYKYTQDKIITISEFILFSMYTGYLIDPIYRTSEFIKTWKDSSAAMARISKIEKIKPQLDEGKIEFKGLKKEISFSKVNVSFGKHKVLKNLSFKIQANKQIALVGYSGGGKSTIVNTILRFIDKYSGSIKFDKNNIKDYTMKSLRSHIGLIQQSPFIFPGTLYQNVKYGKIKATKKEILSAIKQAQLLDFVKSHKRGIHTLVGENGVKLSGGQKQRVAIARVILRNPKIVIMDEATSSLDTATEKKIQIALKNLMKNRTSIVIAHRLNTIISSDKIITIKNGRVISQGTHRQLMKECSYYQELQGIK